MEFPWELGIPFPWPFLDTTPDILFVHGRCAGWAIQFVSLLIILAGVLYRLILRVGEPPKSNSENR